MTAKLAWQVNWKTVLEHLNHDQIAFEFAAQNRARHGQPIITARLTPAAKCGLQNLLRCADQVAAEP
jgi:hypothetical protein